MEDILITVPGAKALIERFDRWPSFHDAEVVSLALNRGRPSTLTVHIFRMTSQVDEGGRYVCDLHTLVTFTFGEIVGLSLADFNHQNVLAGVAIDKLDEGFQLALHPCYGLTGTIRATTLTISFSEGVPERSIYTS